MSDTAYRAVYKIHLHTIGGTVLTETFTDPREAIERYQFLHHDLKQNGYHWLEFGCTTLEGGGAVRTRDICAIQLKKEGAA